MAAIGSLKSAEMIVLLTATPVALLTGATAVTVGGCGPLPPKPKMGSCPPPPHPATKAPNNNAASHGRTLEQLLNLYICSPFDLIQKTFGIMGDSVAESNKKPFFRAGPTAMQGLGRRKASRLSCGNQRVTGCG